MMWKVLHLGTPRLETLAKEHLDIGQERRIRLAIAFLTEERFIELVRRELELA